MSKPIKIQVDGEIHVAQPMRVMEFHEDGTPKTLYRPQSADEKIELDDGNPNVFVVAFVSEKSLAKKN